MPLLIAIQRFSYIDPKYAVLVGYYVCTSVQGSMDRIPSFQTPIYSLDSAVTLVVYILFQSVVPDLNGAKSSRL